MKLLLHTCCAPCSIECIKSLKEDIIDITAYWYNPNIHPYTEYKARLDAFKSYMQMKDIDTIINDEYGLVEFIDNTFDDLENRCENFCYISRLEMTAKQAVLNGYDAFSTTLLISPYQKHDLIKKIGYDLEKKYNIKFIYRDFRDKFREGQNKARELGLYMQKYCGCIFSEEERYLCDSKNKNK